MYDLGNLLKELRIENELTQEELANKLNELHDIKLNKGMISKWEANKSEPRFEYIKYMSKLYNVSLDYLLGLSKFKNKEEELADYKNRMNEFAENHNKNFFHSKNTKVPFVTQTMPIKENQQKIRRCNNLIETAVCVQITKRSSIIFRKMF